MLCGHAPRLGLSTLGQVWKGTNLSQSPPRSPNKVKTGSGLNRTRRELEFVVRFSSGDDSGKPSSSSSNERAETESLTINADDPWGSRVLVPRRIVVGNLLAASIVLGANFVGTTSSLLGLNAELSRAWRLDLLYPVKGFKRYADFSKGFEFVYPEDWVGDQRLLYRAAERAERERNLESFPSSRNTEPGYTRPRNSDPLVAFGPPGTSGELNVSVVIAPISPNFKLESLGSARQVGEQFLASIIAPPTSDKVAVLFDASMRKDDEGIIYYTLDYTVESPTFYRHNLSVCAVCNGLLYTLNAQSPQLVWDDVKAKLTLVADSYHVSKLSP